MTFQPVVPLSGYTGWRFLQRTLDTQQQAFQSSAAVVRATDNFREKIGSIRTAEDLVNNRQLLEVALGAFGLGEDINNKFFIRKILEDGSLNDSALANRLSDKRYLNLAKTFGFGDFGLPNTSRSGFADTIINRYEKQSFEAAVGNTNNEFRLALNLPTELGELISGTKSKNAQWFGVMGSAPLRQVFQTALGLPNQLAAVDIDLQLENFLSRAESTFGTSNLADFLEPENQEKLIRLFLIRSESAQAASVSSGNIALSLLQSNSFTQAV